MGECCIKFSKDMYNLNLIDNHRQKRGKSTNYNYINKNKENNYSSNNIIKNQNIKSFCYQNLNNNLIKGKSQKKEENYLFNNKKSQINKFKLKYPKKIDKNNKINLPLIANKNLSNNERKNEPIKIFANYHMKESTNKEFKNNNIKVQYYNSKNENNINVTNNSSTNSSYLKNKDALINNKKNINSSSIKDNQNEAKIDFDKQSNKSKGKRNISYDSINSKNNNIEYNNNKIIKGKEITNSNEKENIRNRHVSTNKYKKDENLRKSYQKFGVGCESKEIPSSNSIKPKGLYNLGLSCYMNSLLQCLFHIKELREYFIERNNFRNDQVVCKAFSEVMYGLKNDPKDYFEAKLFKKEMGNKNNLFSGVRAGDSKDLFINLIDSILSETTIDNDDEQRLNNSLDLTNKRKVFEELNKEIDMKNIINELFIGFYETKYQWLLIE